MYCSINNPGQIAGWRQWQGQVVGVSGRHEGLAHIPGLLQHTWHEVTWVLPRIAFSMLHVHMQCRHWRDCRRKCGEFDCRPQLDSRETRLPEHLDRQTEAVSRTTFLLGGGQKKVITFGQQADKQGWRI
jgi:hypothetical protein